MGNLPPFLCEIVHTSTWKCFVFLLGKFFIASGKYFPLFWWNFSISTGKSFLFLMRNGIHSHWETFLIFTWKYFTSTLKRHSVLWLLLSQPQLNYNSTHSTQHNKNWVWHENDFTPQPPPPPPGTQHHQYLSC